MLQIYFIVVLLFLSISRLFYFLLQLYASPLCKSLICSFSDFSPFLTLRVKIIYQIIFPSKHRHRGWKPCTLMFRWPGSYDSLLQLFIFLMLSYAFVDNIFQNSVVFKFLTGERRPKWVNYLKIFRKPQMVGRCVRNIHKTPIVFVKIFCQYAKMFSSSDTKLSVQYRMVWGLYELVHRVPVMPWHSNCRNKN